MRAIVCLSIVGLLAFTSGALADSPLVQNATAFQDMAQRTIMPGGDHVPGTRAVGNDCTTVVDLGILPGGNTDVPIDTYGFANSFAPGTEGTCDTPCGWYPVLEMYGVDDGILKFQVSVAGTWNISTCGACDTDNALQLRADGGSVGCPGDECLDQQDGNCGGTCAAPYQTEVTADLVTGVDYYLIAEYTWKTTGPAIATFGGPCTDDSQCSDGVFCNGVEECVEGACVAGPTWFTGMTMDCEWYQTCDEDTDSCIDPDDCISFKTDPTLPGSFSVQNMNDGCFGVLSGDDIQLSDHAGKALVSYQFYTQARNLGGNADCLPAGCAEEPLGSDYTVYADLWTVIGEEDPDNAGGPGAPIPGTHCEATFQVMPGGSPADVVLCDEAHGIVPGTILPEGDDYWKAGVDVWLMMTTSNDAAGFSISYGAAGGETIGGPLPKPAAEFPFFRAAMDEEWALWYAGTGLEGIVMIQNCNWELGTPGYGEPIPGPDGWGFSLFDWSDNDFRGVEFCTTPVGQCCLPDGISCVMTETEGECDALLGTWTYSTVGDPHACSDLDEDGIDKTCGAGDNCPDDANPGQEDCNADGEGDACEPAEEQDDDGDGYCNCLPDPAEEGDPCDDCDADPDKVIPGICGCGVADTDSDGDSVADCLDPCPYDPNKWVPGTGLGEGPGQCGCGVLDTDSDGDGLADCIDCAPGVDDAVYCPGCAFPECGEAIPTISEWGLVILALLLLVAGKVYFGRRARA